MVFATIWISGRLDLIITEHDADAPRGGYTTEPYLNALEDGRIISYGPNYIFLQDNAAIQGSEAAELWFKTQVSTL